MPSPLEPKLLNKLEKEIREINLLPMSSAISKGDVMLVVGSCRSPFNVYKLINLDKDRLEELVSFTPKLKCWYVPIFSVNKLWRLTEQPIWIENHPRIKYNGAFEFYYWKFFSRILNDFHHLAPSILGISLEVNYLFTILRDNGASVDSIVNRTFTGNFSLCLPSLTRIFSPRISGLSGFNKFLYGTDVALVKTYR